MTNETKISYGGKEISSEQLLSIMKIIAPPEASKEPWVTEPVYGIESVTLDESTKECDAHYSLEKFFRNAKDAGAPPAGKMRIKFLGMGTEVVFADGSEVKNDMNDVFNSPYVKGKIAEFNNYYIKEKGYRPYTQEDARTFKMDVAQTLRKLLQFNFVNKLDVKFFNGTAIYGLFSFFIGKAIDKLAESPGGAEGGLKSLLVPTLINRWIPFCIAYTQTSENGEKRVIVKRFLYSGIFTKDISGTMANADSGGKEIGTVK